MKIRLIILTFMLVILSALTSCKKGDYCALDVTSLMNIGFYKMQDDEMKSLTMTNLLAQGNTVDSVISESSVTKISLQLSNDADSSVYIFTMTISDTSIVDTVSTFTDTIKFNYTRQLFLLSYECGFMYNYTITDIQNTHNIIDTITITERLISTADAENLRILF
jgi:hypothetical protein